VPRTRETAVFSLAAGRGEEIRGQPVRARAIRFVTENRHFHSAQPLVKSRLRAASGHAVRASVDLRSLVERSCFTNGVDGDRHKPALRLVRLTARSLLNSLERS